MAKIESCSRLGKVGGQAVLEGVMMRGTSGYTTAVRKPDGTIVRDIHKNEIKKKNFFMRLPVIRGVVAFVQSMILSFSTLSFAAEALNVEEETKFEKWLSKHLGKSITGIIMGVGTVLGLALGVFLFMVLPAFLSGFFPVSDPVKKVIEGVMKILIFLAYVSLVSLMGDIRRTFMYHGAEHKSVFCYELGLPLTVENVKAQKRFHPRCGTSFMFLMMFVGIFIGLLIGFIFPATRENTLLYVGFRILLLPVTMGLGYEIIRAAGRYDNVLIRIITAPGLWFQRITTREPTDDMIEVAIVALKSALPEEFPEESVYEGIDQPAPASSDGQDGPSDPATASPEATA
ncbi:MAG: DUF1385 domain-containing protein [Clostridia bacterium]|nr:DUF1385 domain-containing protein [Clostridia bacterium]